jgi:hypothetical protein
MLTSSCTEGGDCFPLDGASRMLISSCTEGGDC